MILLVLVFAACSAPQHSVSEFANSYAGDHERIAVLPFRSTINLRPKEMESITDEQWDALEIEQGYMVQESVVHYLNGKNLLVTIQSPSMTNKLLSDNAIGYGNIHLQDATEICRILDVDAIVEGAIATEKPMSDLMAGAIEMGQILERTLLNSSISGILPTATNVGSCNLRLVDGKTGDMVYSFQNGLSMGTGSTTQDVIDRFMNQASQKFKRIYKKAKRQKLKED